MFHKAVDLKLGDGTVVEVTFQNGKVISFDMSSLFSKYPQLKELENRQLFLSGALQSPYGIVWNDMIDIETETIYEEGKLVRSERPAAYMIIGEEVRAARARKGLSQKELSAVTGIDQADISRIERGIANPSVETLYRIAKALDSELKIHIA
ncbi:MAG: helix-turn-helix domain-containing protein [Firmicutes bacterium]|nr:helix-turn-helix domain-containing protein [Bacillota bacterium]